MIFMQLVQARRERDYNREALCTFERKVSEEQRRMEKDNRQFSELVQKCNDMSKEIANLEAEVKRLSMDLKLANEAYDADRKLWMIERTHFASKSDSENSGIAEGALKAAEDVQKKYAEYQKYYTAEVDRLNTRLRQLTNEAMLKQQDNQRTIKELREQIKVLEISQKNLIQTRDIQIGAKEVLEAEVEKLQETVHLSEVQKVTRKFKITSIIDQLQLLADPVRRSSRSDTETPDLLKFVVSQLKTIKDEDSQGTTSTGSNCSDSSCTVAPSTSAKYGERLCSENDRGSREPSENLSQSSLSIKSYSTLPSSTYKWSTLHSATINQTRSGSFDGNLSATKSTRKSTVTTHSASPVRKVSSYPDPPPSFLLNKDQAVEYDKDGRRHFIPRIMTRSTSYDRCELSISTSRIDDVTVSESDIPKPHPRTNSAGANILYKIRREELARGGLPSVRLIAKAFDSMDSPTSEGKSNSKRSIFGSRKTHSVDIDNSKNGGSSKPVSVLQEVLSADGNPVEVTVLGRNTSLSQIEELMGSQSPYGTFHRSGRNPLKNMGAKIVERVRRSLSRSSVGRSRSNVADESNVEHEAKKVTHDKENSTLPSDSKEKQKSKVTDSPKGGDEKSTKRTRPIKKKVKKAATTNIAQIASKFSTPK
ncbi:hypothetical protein AB6A40_002997 [Gnathostoma spinigerum]|uniref:Uncharacterized protein n=1 Tax=Gnathostoma spinigerum TaxID=75299 RepID=A0ABD6EH62_9BILA